MSETPEGWYRWEDKDLIISVRVQPRASKDEINSPSGGYLKVRITAAPVDGKANLHLVKFLAKSFGVKRSDVSMLSGNSSRNKIFRINSPMITPTTLIKGM